MNYSPKLKKAMERIKKVLEEEDIAGVVVLHEPGFSEYVIKLDPGYSCAKYQGDGRLRIRAKLEDFNGDKAARTKKIADTSNMFKLLTETVINIIYPIHEISQKMDEVVGAEHTDSKHTGANEQNN